jgi:hypothetical protein
MEKVAVPVAEASAVTFSAVAGLAESSPQPVVRMTINAQPTQYRYAESLCRLKKIDPDILILLGFLDNKRSIATSFSRRKAFYQRMSAPPVVRLVEKLPA